MDDAAKCTMHLLLFHAIYKVNCYLVKLVINIAHGTIAITDINLPGTGMKATASIWAFISAITAIEITTHT